MPPRISMTFEDLRAYWKQWASDPKGTRFGQYVMHKVLPPLCACPTVYFADTGNSWELLMDHITGRKDLVVTQLGQGGLLEQDFS